MRFFFLTIVSVLMGVSCAPRDGAQPMEPRLRLFESGAKLPSCAEPGAPTWRTLRLFHEMNFLFDHLDELRLVVMKGGRTCVEVNTEDPIEIEYEIGPGTGQFRRSGVHYTVRELELMETRDLLSDERSLSFFAGGMGIAVEELRGFLLESPRRDQVHIIRLGRPGGFTGSASSSEVEVVSEPGQRLSTCQGPEDPVWESLRIYYDNQAIFNKIDQFEQVVTKGSRSCLEVGRPVEIFTQSGPGQNQFNPTGVSFTVRKLERMSTRALLNDSSRLQEAAEGMSWTMTGLTEFLNADPWIPEVTITHMQTDSSGTPEQDTGPTGFQILKMPEDEGQTLSVCNAPWTDLRIPRQMSEPLVQALLNQEAQVVVSPGSLNCLPVGQNQPLSQHMPEAGWSLQPHLQVSVRSVLARPRQDLLKDPMLLKYVAKDMAVDVGELTWYLEALDTEMINATYIEWLEGPL